MFRIKYYCSSVSVLLCVVILVKCSSVEIETNMTSEANHHDATSKKLPEEKRPFVYRRQNFNESVEKIQTTSNGTMIKSAFIPVIPQEMTTNYYGVDKEHRENVGLVFQKNDSDSLKDSKIPPSFNKENIIEKNGKKYRIVKIKKSTKNIFVNQVKNQQIQRRTFSPLPNFFSILPLKWMTRQKKNKTQPETGSENATKWSRVNHVGDEKESSNETHSSEKIKKLLNLFTIVKFDNGECYTEVIKGTCLHPAECKAKGGNFAATCAGEIGVCCYTEKTCGETSNENTTYFINEGFPDSSTTAPKLCTLTIEKTTPDVKQLRLDFEIFQLRDPTNGTCLHDRLLISGHDSNDVIPEICGSNTGQHIYVDVEDSNGPFNLNVIIVGEYFHRNFRIKVTQVKKGDEMLAPRNCLQHYTEPTGYVQTFNYQHYVNENSSDEVTNGYFNNLNYAICIKKQKDFCSISYENEETDLPNGQPTFQLVNVDEEGQRLLPPGQAGAETFDCPDDYIVVNGIRLCGEKLNDATIEFDFTRNHPVTDSTNGPFIVSVRTDAAQSGRGFHLKYIQNPCLT